MKKIITLCLMLVMSGVAMSQTKQSPIEANATKTTENWATKLMMTADQKAKTYDIVLAKMEARKKVMDEFKVSRDEKAKSAAMAKIKGEMKVEMKSVLTTGQKYQQWESMVDKESK
jgi:hypothetical protein